MSLPNDIITEIFRATPRYRDCVAWALTCKRFWAIWLKFRATLGLFQNDTYEIKGLNLCIYKLTHYNPNLCLWWNNEVKKPCLSQWKHLHIKLEGIDTHFLCIDEIGARIYNVIGNTINICYFGHEYCKHNPNCCSICSIMPANTIIRQIAAFMHYENIPQWIKHCLIRSYEKNIARPVLTKEDKKQLIKDVFGPEKKISKPGPTWQGQNMPKKYLRKADVRK